MAWNEIDWTAERVESEWIFQEIEFPSFKPLGKLNFITGGSGSLSALNDMKMTGTLEIDGGLPNEDNMIRVFYSCKNVLGESTGEIPFATYFVSVPEPKHRATSEGERLSGSIDCTSTLSLLAKKLLHVPLVLPKGTPAIEVCKELISECRLPYKADETSYVTGRDRDYDEGTTYLDVIRDLCDIAGFRAPYPTELGTIVLEKYYPPFTSTPVYTFERGESAIHMRDIPFSTNHRETPTTMVVSYSTENYKIIGVATNNDPSSPSSLVNRNNIATEEYRQIEELTQRTQQEQEDAVRSKARSFLLANSDKIEHMEIKHLFVPYVRPNRVVRIIDQNIDFNGAVTNTSVDFKPSAIATTKSRMMTNPQIDVDVSIAFFGEFVLPDDEEE